MTKNLEKEKLSIRYFILILNHMNILTRIILKVKWIFSFLNTRGTHRTFNFQFGYVVVTESPRQRQSMKQEDSAVYLDVPAPAKAESTFPGAPLELI